MRYRSKLGPELVIIFAISIGPAFYMVIKDMDWPVLGILLAVMVFIVHMVATTHYTIDGGMLRIKSGFIYNKSIAIQSIQKITPTSNPISSPAASIDRLEVFYNGNSSVIISPKDKRGFIMHLLELNPDIISNL
jgi:Bacterial PH domain